MKGRTPIFDALRLGLASLVILSHSFPLLGLREPGIFGATFGTIAVDGFFLLSGYLITASWQANPDVFAFGRRRLYRIVPGFVVAFLVCVLIVAPLGGATSWALTLGRDLLGLQPPTIDAFAGTPYPMVNGAMWTISWEAACYVAVPLTFPLLRRRGWAIGAWAALLFVTLALPFWPAPRLFLMFLTGAMLTTQPLRFPALDWRFPDISYGVYLYGWPIQKLLTWWGVSNPFALFILALPIAMGLGWLSFRFVERPAMGRFRKTPEAVPV